MRILCTCRVVTTMSELGIEVSAPQASAPVIDPSAVETAAPILPDRVEWRSPGGYVIVLDEDGVNLRPGTSTLEAAELDRLLAVIDAARTAQRLGAVSTPRVPGREPWAQLRLDHLAHDVVRAVEKELDRGRF